MIGNNSFLRNKELSQAKLNTEKKSLEKNQGTSQEQLGRVKFQDIADKMYISKISQIRGKKIDTQTMMDNAKKAKKSLDVKREILFYKKWD